MQPNPLRTKSRRCNSAYIPTRTPITFSQEFLNHCLSIIQSIDQKPIETIATILATTRKNKGRLFILGSGGGAGHASHAVCDFRKICEIEAYAPYDNVSELTARTNDEGWDNTLHTWLKTSNLKPNDTLFIFSVGGGNAEKNISTNLVLAVKYAKKVGAKVVGIVGKDGGYTKQTGDAVAIIPPVAADLITPITEGFQAILWHLIVSHPALKINKTKWESTK